MEKKLGQEPAFPTPIEDILQHVAGENLNPQGMSKRFYAACVAMQGLIIKNGIRVSAMGAIEDDVYNVDENIIDASYRIADELLKQENQ